MSLDVPGLCPHVLGRTRPVPVPATLSIAHSRAEVDAVFRKDSSKVVLGLEAGLEMGLGVGLD